MLWICKLQEKRSGVIESVDVAVWALIAFSNFLSPKELMSHHHHHHGGHHHSHHSHSSEVKSHGSEAAVDLRPPTTHDFLVSGAPFQYPDLANLLITTTASSVASAHNGEVITISESDTVAHCLDVRTSSRRYFSVIMRSTCLKFHNVQFVSYFSSSILQLNWKICDFLDFK